MCESFSVPEVFRYQTLYLVYHTHQPIVSKAMYCNGRLYTSGQGI